MEKHKEFSKQEKLLQQVLEECMEDDLSFVPSEREIARSHRFSGQFEKTMKGFMDDMSSAVAKTTARRHFSGQYRQWAACILVVCLCGGLGLLWHRLAPAGGGMKSLEGAADAPETAEGSDAGMAGLEAADEAMPQEAPSSAEEKPSDVAGAGMPAESREYCGQTVRLSEQQDIPGTLEHVAALINCPVLDEDNQLLFLTIGNTGEENLQYYDRYRLDVCMDGAWYTVPAEDGGDGQWLTLEAGMAVDEEIDLSLYRIDHDAQKYRLVVCVGQELVSAEFTFEGAFVRRMEEQEAGNRKLKRHPSEE